MKSLIIAEKPSVAADLARALGKVPKHGDHYENEEYVISSAVGHVVELQMPEDIDKKKYGFWRLETLPIIPEKFELKPINDSKDRFALLKKLIADHDAPYAQQWRGLGDEYQHKMMAGIVGFELRVTSMQSKFKINQHRTESHARMREQYAAGGDAERELGEWMDRLGLGAAGQPQGSAN